VVGVLDDVSRDCAGDLRVAVVIARTRTVADARAQMKAALVTGIT